MRILFISILMLVSLTGCQEFAKDVGHATKSTAKAVGNAGNRVAKTIEKTIESEKE